MENDEQILLLNVNPEDVGKKNISSVKPKRKLTEQEEKELIIRFEEDLAACFLDRMAIIL